MSVVNKMLQDLETRKKRSAITADYVPNNEQVAFKPWMLGVSVAVIAIAILISQINWQSDGQLNMYAQQLPPAPVAPTQATVFKEAVQHAGNELPEYNDNSVALTALAHDEANKASTEVATQDINTLSTSRVTQIQGDVLPTSEPVKAQRIVVSAPQHTVSDQIQAQNTKLVAVDADTKSRMNSPPLQSTEKPSSEFRVAPSSGEKVGISLLREQARIALNKDDIAGAVKALESLITAYPEDVKARKQLASLLFSHHGIERAYTVLKEGLQITPADNAMRVMLARVAFKTGDFQDAHNALAAHPFPELADIELISFRAALAERLSQYEDAHQDYKLLVAREPSNAKWWLGLGVSQDKLRLVKPALESYQQAKDLQQLPTQVHTFVDERIAVLARQS